MKNTTPHLSAEMDELGWRGIFNAQSGGALFKAYVTEDAFPTQCEALSAVRGEFPSVAVIEDERCFDA